MNTKNIPAWAIAQALREWRDAIPESTYRAEVEKQVAERAREILTRPPPLIERYGVLKEVAIERQRQDAKWGVQNHPDLPEEAIQLDPAERCEYFSLMAESVAKTACEEAFKDGRGSYADIFLEEVSEAIAAANNEKRLREELVQCAAVACAWVECIDRRGATGMEHAP